ncbi:hypothetical protein BN8_01320 [Fibrisoma limi BUZ 3]|uniref:Uncharacterized protein n=1 Tax=Fibrisoma limi BUZ 3 TaxID=1185876 RepID=I2GEK3_9BACT|nr:hypothetical protein BN8_01320 [Fibrisoma limi BUZ 3]
MVPLIDLSLQANPLTERATTRLFSEHLENAGAMLAIQVFEKKDLQECNHFC